MKYGYDDIDKIVGFSTWNEKKKLDELFRIDTWMYTNLGTDSTKTEKEAVRKKSRAIYRAINKINPSIGKNFLYHMDE
jgi:hypothetical protein|tara:strand:- start:482 stop:715 length:234 start_codon:yes stop_codon:yes gene_type:complete